VLVTGAGGTVGAYAVALAEAAGYRVIASDLRRSGLRVPVRGEVRPGDLRDEKVAARLVAGCDFVIHTAAQLAVGADPAELTKTNSEAVCRLYEAAEAEGVKRFVHMSTAMLYAPSEGPLLEDTPLHPRGPYGMSKHGAENFLRGRCDAKALPWTILRAAPIYGRRGRHFAASLLALGPLARLATPLLPRPTGGPEGTMVHAADVARALLFVLERPDCEFEVFNVSDDDPMPLGDRVALTLDAYGLRSVDTRFFPAGLLGFLGKILQRPVAYEGVDTLALSGWRAVVLRHGLKAALRPRIDRESLTLLYEHLVVDASKLRALGWEPRNASFARGWADVLRWYQAERWVPRYGG